MAEPERNNEVTQGAVNSSNCALHYDEVMLKAVYPIFVHKINPELILNVFWKYDRNVLSIKDKELIKKQTDNKGTSHGAETLLGCLRYYKNWFPCLIKVLKDKDVQQEYLANLMLDAIDQLQSDGQVDTTVKALAERDVLIERLKTELENKKSEAETDKQNYEIETKKLKAELQNCQNMLQKEMDKSTAKEKEMLEQKALAEKEMLEQKALAEKEMLEQKALVEKEMLEQKALAEKEMLEQKVLAEKCKQDLCVVNQRLRTELEEANKTIKQERDRNAIKEKKLLNEKVLAETELTEVKAQAEMDKQEQDLEYQKINTNFVALVNALLRNATTSSSMELAMHCFAESGQYHAMDVLIEKGVDINKQDSNGKTALMAAAGAGYFQTVNFLIFNGADIELVDNNGYRALSHAIMFGHADCVQALLEAGDHQRLNIPDPNGKTLLMLAAASVGDHVKCLQNLLNAGADINLKDGLRYTVLAHAAASGNAKCVQTLLEANNSQHVNIANSNKETPLMLAVKSKGDNLLCLQNLLDAGADINMIDNHGYTVLAHAADSGNANFVQTLLQAKDAEHLDIANSFGQTPLMLAAKSKGDNVQCLQNLLDAGAEITSQDVLDYTALAYAAENGNINCLETLLKVSSHNINTPNTDKQTPLMLAAGSKGDNVQCVEKLLSYGADPAMKDYENVTALYYAIKNDNVQCEKALQKVLAGSPTTNKRTTL